MASSTDDDQVAGPGHTTGAGAQPSVADLRGETGVVGGAPAGTVHHLSDTADASDTADPSDAADSSDAADPSDPESPDVAGPRPPRPFWVELPILLVIAFAMTFVMQTFFFKVYYIPSGSMEQTLHGVSSGGDRVVVNKIVYDFAEPEPGEVVVFSGPPSWAVEAMLPGPSTWYGKLFQAVGSVVGIAPPNEKDFVKRIIATGGQTVQCCDEAGSVLVNGSPLTEPYIFEDFPFTPGVSDCTSVVKSQRCFGPVTVPDGSLWLMGDHRMFSKDSAFGCRGNLPPTGCQGAVPVDNVIGKAIFVVLPVSRWSIIHAPDIQAAAACLMVVPVRRRHARKRWRRRF